MGWARARLRTRVINRSSGGYQAFIKRASSVHQSIIKRSSSGWRAHILFINCPSSGPQAPLRLLRWDRAWLRYDIIKRSSSVHQSGGSWPEQEGRRRQVELLKDASSIHQSGGSFLQQRRVAAEGRSIKDTASSHPFVSRPPVSPNAGATS